jgi:hypothetical protein
MRDKRKSGKSKAKKAILKNFSQKIPLRAQ